MRPFRVLAALAALVLFAAGCSIQPDASPRDIPDEDRGAFGADEATGDEAGGSALIFLLAPPASGGEQLLRSVMRDVGTTSAAVRALFAGPNSAEQADELDTAIPPDLVMNSERTLGRVSIIDVNDALDSLDAVDLRMALAQIVMTATASDDVDSVQIRVNGEEEVWPRGDGELTGRPLTPFDYPGMVESTQPPYPSLSSAAA
jgi:Sporulation and spore germination